MAIVMTIVCLIFLVFCVQVFCVIITLTICKIILLHPQIFQLMLFYQITSPRAEFLGGPD
jgi:hypothetical protein